MPGKYITSEERDDLIRKSPRLQQAVVDYAANLYGNRIQGLIQKGQEKEIIDKAFKSALDLDISQIRGKDIAQRTHQFLLTAAQTVLDPDGPDGVINEDLGVVYKKAPGVEVIYDGPMNPVMENLEEMLSRWFANHSSRTPFAVFLSELTWRQFIREVGRLPHMESFGRDDYRWHGIPVHKMPGLTRRIAMAGFIHDIDLENTGDTLLKVEDIDDPSNGYTLGRNSHIGEGRDPYGLLTRSQLQIDFERRND